MPNLSTVRRSSVSDYDLYLFHEGSNFHSYNMLGAHVVEESGQKGVRFSVWAPNARQVRVLGDFNCWYGDSYVMELVNQSGVWTLFVPDLNKGDLYKYEIITPCGEVLQKADPYAFYAECRPKSASVVFPLDGYRWHDNVWQDKKKNNNIYEQAVLIYEVHLASWRRGPGGRMLTYRELAEELVDYVTEMGYTHIELMPLVEHPFDGSWGYQATGYYAATSRYGTPHDFMYFIDRCHQQGIGVIMDWVPGHFCKDAHGLANFDGTPLYEPVCPERRENRGWGTANFDFSRPEVCSFLISNAIFWLSVYHIDGLRVDAVANMIYLDYNREQGEWMANRYGGNGNLEAIAFVKRLNETVFADQPGTMAIAEESTSWPMVSWPTYAGGLGFNFKWNMGWMNDMLDYMSQDPIHRKYRHNMVTFSFMYAFSENFVLPLSHDEVVHGKKSLLDKMPGDYWNKFANLRAFYGYWMAHPGKKLLFMGGEFGQFIEWKFDDSLDWHLLDCDMHQKMSYYVKDLNHFYQREGALWEKDFSWQGFKWIDCQDASQSVIVFMRNGNQPDNFLIVICNFTPLVRYDYCIGVPQAGNYVEVFNSDWVNYGGSGQINDGTLESDELAWHNQSHSLRLKLPPMAVVYLKKQN